MQNLGPRLLNRALNRNLVNKGGATGLFASAPLDLRFALQKTLDPRVTHTRASSATFVDSSGVLRSAVTNLVLRSEEFDNASWSKTNSSITSNATTAPNGTITADALIEDTAASTHVALQTYGVTTGTTYTLSCYAKAAGRNFAQLLFIGGFASNITAIFDLTNGSVGTTAGSPVTAAVAVGNGWYRLSITATTISTITTSIQLRPAITSSAANYQGDGTSGLYLWGAQLEQASTVGDYVPTTSAINSAPRFDHNPTTGESLGLLVEEARTNSVANNTMVGAVAGTPGTLPTGWPFQTNSNGLAVSIVGTGSESGIAYLDWRISGTATAAAIGDICFGRASALTAQTWTISSYLKLVSGSLSGVTGATLSLIEETAANAFVTGALYSIALPTTAPLITQRPTASRTLTGGATVALVRTNLTFNVSSGSTVDFTIRIGLPQLEQGAFATSPILTSTATVTRAADVASITGTNFSSWYNQTEGTAYWEGSRATTSGFPDRFRFSDGTNANRWFSYWDAASNSSTFEVITGSASQVGIFGGASLLNVPIKTAFGVAVNNTSAVYSGNIQGTDTSVTVPTISQVTIATGLTGTIKRLTYWPVRLANTTLQQITQP